MTSRNSLYVSAATVAGLVVSGALIFNKEGQPLQAALGFSLASFLFTAHLIPRMSRSFIHAGFSGKDLSKPKRPLLFPSDPIRR
jgi:hypothetical protein